MIEELTIEIKYKGQSWKTNFEYDGEDPIEDFLMDAETDWLINNSITDFQEHKDTYSIDYYLTENI